LAIEADLGRVLSLVLAHDLVEIYAGDTYAYDDAALAGQKAREEEAARRLFGELPPDVGARLSELWHEFEAGETNEAKVALACDRMQGFMQNFASGGRAWRENGVSRERTKHRMAPAYAADPVFGAVLDELYARADAVDLFNTAPPSGE
jgi:putative hydrolase of HD superfamily